MRWSRSWSAAYGALALSALSVFAATPTKVMAQAATPVDANAATSVKAQEALRKGLAAAGQKQWEIAIRYFGDAHAASPLLPEALFNLGLSEAQVPGRELRAICWFEAYLAAAPEAANTQAVRSQIDELDVRAEVNARKMIAVLKDLKAQPSELVGLVAGIGDVDGARALFIQDPNNTGITLISKLTDLRRFSDAISIADQIGASEFLYKQIALAEIKAGLLPEAATAIDRIHKGPSSSEYRVGPEVDLAVAEYQTPAMREQAIALLGAVREEINANAGIFDWKRGRELVALGVALWKMENRKAADVIFDDVHASAGGLKSGDKMTVFADLGRAMYETGRPKEAVAFLRQAEAAADESKRSGGIEPVFIILLAYLDGRDWDGANAYMLRDGGVYQPWVNEINEAKARSAFDDAFINRSSSAAAWVAAWENYVKLALNGPLFMDLSGAVRGLGNAAVPGVGGGTATNAENSDVEGKVSSAASTLVDRLAKVRILRSQH